MNIIIQITELLKQNDYLIYETKDKKSNIFNALSFADNTWNLQDVDWNEIKGFIKLEDVSKIYSVTKDWKKDKLLLEL